MQQKKYQVVNCSNVKHERKKTNMKTIIIFNPEENNRNNTET